VKPAIDLTCGECGSNRLAIPAQAGDEGAVVCEECGCALGTLAEVKTRVEQAVLRGQGERR
jgi:transcription initiation factor TFIIIB Brf1 subunit/transcription initiation factor TFIIB